MFHVSLKQQIASVSTGMEFLSLCIFLILQCGFFIAITDAYTSLGCYQDVPSNRDLANQVTVSDYNVDTCVAKCVNDGYAYAGLQPAFLCFCDNRYGKHGTATGCTTDCGTAGKTCGGTNKSDVYYTVKNSDWNGKELEYGYKSDSKSFDDARKACILQSVTGELAAVTKTSITSIVTAVPAGGSAWVGLWKKNSYFAYVDENMGNFTENDLWAAGIPATGECVYVSQSDSKLRADSCSANHAYVCENIKPTPATDTNPTAVKVNSQEQAIKDWFNNSTNITMYIVMPMFGLCYGGSCLLYALAKLYRSCRKKQRQKMIAQSRVDLLSDVRPIQPVNTRKASTTAAGNDTTTRKNLTKIPPPPPPYDNKNVTHRKKDVSKVSDQPEKNALLTSQSTSPESNKSESNHVRTPANLFVVAGASHNDSRSSLGDSDSKKLRTPLRTNQVNLEERNKAMVPVQSDNTKDVSAGDEGKHKFKDAAITMRDQYFYTKALEIAARRRREEEERRERVSADLEDDIYNHTSRSRLATSSTSIGGDKQEKRHKKDRPPPLIEDEAEGGEEKQRKKKKKKGRDDDWDSMLTQGGAADSGAPPENRQMSIDEIIQAKIMAAQKSRRKKRILAS